jgi:hypothetical protein
VSEHAAIFFADRNGPRKIECLLVAFHSISKKNMCQPHSQWQTLGGIHTQQEMDKEQQAFY